MTIATLATDRYKVILNKRFQTYSIIDKDTSATMLIGLDRENALTLAGKFQKLRDSESEHDAEREIACDVEDNRRLRSLRA